MIKKYTAVLSLLFLPFFVWANEIAILPQNPNLTTGTLPNGTHYYIYKSQAVKGMADFALVQKLGPDINDANNYGFVTAKARKTLAELPQFHNQEPQSYLISNGASLSNEGFIEFRNDATIYRFKNILIARKDAVIDSTLLVLFSIINDFSSDETDFQKEWCSPERNAIIVSGDVDPLKIKEKLSVLSLMVPSKEASKELPRYSWISSDESTYNVNKVEGKTLSKIELSYSMARMPEVYMNSVQPMIMEKFIGELCLVLENRIKDILFAKSIPYTSLSCTYLSSLDSSSDESFDVSIEILESDIEKALSAIAIAMGTVDWNGIDEYEYLYAKKTYLNLLEKKNEEKSITNSASLERCIAVFLYNAPLSSRQEEYRFITNRVMDDAVELKLLEQISKALLDSKKNLSVKITTSREDINVADLRKEFEGSWNGSYDFNFKNWYGGELSFDVVTNQKLSRKMKSVYSRKEPISGGQIWRYSNGVNVIYKKMKTGGKLHFALASTGGYASLPELATGEGAYLTDIFKTFAIGDIPGEAYRRSLASKGIEIDAKVGVFDSKIFGTAPMDSLSLTLAVLKDIALNRKIDTLARDAYIANVPLQLASMDGTTKERLVKVEEVLCPGYLYSSFMSQDVVTKSLYERADELFAKIFNNIDESFIVLIGDQDEEIVQKQILPIILTMPVSPVVINRPIVRVQPIVGNKTIVEQSKNPNTDFIVSNELRLTTENYIAAQISTFLLQDRLSNRLTADGFQVKSTMRFNQSPDERLTIYLSLVPVNPEGLANPRTNLTALELIANMRAALNEDIDIDYIKKLLPFYQAILKEEYNRDSQKPSLISEAVMLRYMSGKDLMTRYLPSLDSITPEVVMNVINKLRDGATVEYIVE